MTDQEQIEAWRKDFEKFIVKAFDISSPTAEKRRDSGEYFYAHVQLAWLSWCEAKRAQKPVELPKRNLDGSDFGGNYRNGIVDGYGICFAAITGKLDIAGIPYTVKGE